MRKILVILQIIFLTSCSTDKDSDEAEQNVTIRIENASIYKYEDIYVHPSSSYATNGGNQNYGTLDPNTFSDYKQFDVAYGYAAVKAKIDGKTYTLMPIDFVGEIPLKPGKYTYKITANESTDEYQKLDLTLVEN